MADRSFGIHKGEGVRRWLGAHSRASRVGRTGRGVFSMPIFSLCADTGAATWRKEERGSRVTSDGGLILVRELDERLGFGELIEQHLPAG